MSFDQYCQEFRIIASPLFPGLLEICRHDGPYICFNQLRARHFQNVPRGTLSGWVHKLGIEKLKCTDKELELLRCIVPEEKGKPFFLLKQCHAQRLLDRSRERLVEVRAQAPYPGFNCMAYGTVHASTRPTFQLPTAGEPWHILSTPSSSSSPPPPPPPPPLLLPLKPKPPPAQLSLPGPSPSPPPCPSPSPSPSPPPGPAQLSCSSPDASRCDQELSGEDDPRCGSEDDPVIIPSAKSRSQNLAKGRSAHTIADKDMSLSLRRDVAGLVDFYSATFEAKRKGQSLAEPTVNKIVERLRMFFSYVKHCRGLEPDFSHLANSQLLGDYATYLSNVRQLKAVTISRNVHALEKGLQYMLRNKRAHEEEALEPLAELRHVRGQCEKIDRLNKMKEREGVGCKPKQNLIYAEILELCKELKSSFEEESRSLEKARKIHDLVLMLMYLYYVPRAHEVRTLVLLQDCPAGEIVAVGPPDRENVIAFYDDNSIELLLTRYKTDRTYGPCKLPVPFNSPIAYYIRQYAGKFREKLLLGNDHAFMFVNARGKEFATASAFSRYLGQITESGTGKRGATNSLRHAIATKFIADPELCANEAFRNSLSRVMRHSRETQEKCYVDLTNAARSEQALGILSQSAGNELFGDCIASNDKPGNTSDSEDDELQPSVGDLVALVDPQSTRQDPVIFIAKVIRFSASRDEVTLAEFEELEEDCFKLKITSCRPWVESVHSLIWPIDIAYDAASRAYKLRSSKHDIYESVVSPRKKRKIDSQG